VEIEARALSEAAPEDYWGFQVPRRPCTFRQTDIAKAVRGAQAAGLAVARVEVDRDGRIVVVAASGAVEHNAASTRNEWDAAA
jgi:hypothetical protein